ncbi:MAG: prefoldin subunit alpha [Candidatus Nitrosotenuis sp.]|uniref:Prefoldin subunit alpha n=1 Tax=Candidatus Nitrosotenuis uzonensis TaxID=1407055 RepID=V6ARS7_9ARCH|nr:prefoldin subunit alpha [Candidatus Nitrosotenuis uzonensis]MCA2003634.1 prefoldin subunit alpha [Candidatus Nitrosotenuis sp.]CAE6485316.1 Prefoldin subunit alpha [Candidatus Nitrosotenuis uzonensis]CDI05235.1 Prefoldin subunit alpha [Candidatus Nitrosotenuis uzonensis]
MSEEQAQQLLYQMQVLESFAANLEQKEHAIVTFLREAMASIQSIKAIQNQESESLVPVGLGTYVKATIFGNSKVIQDIGAGIAVEKDPESAINYLETRIKELQVALNDTSTQKHETMMRIEQLKEEMNNFIQSANPSQQ